MAWAAYLSDPFHDEPGLREPCREARGLLGWLGPHDGIDVGLAACVWVKVRRGSAAPGRLAGQRSVEARAGQLSVQQSSAPGRPL